MKSLNIDILESPGVKKSRIFLGIIFLIIAVLWVLQATFRNGVSVGFHNLKASDIIFSLFLLMMAMIHILEGNGKSVLKLFGEAYIHIDERTFCIKKWIIYKEWKLSWDEIEEAEYTLLQINFRLKSGLVKTLTYNGIDYSHLQEVKKTIIEIAESKDLKIVHRI